jgi:hypothetical protein
MTLSFQKFGELSGGWQSKSPVSKCYHVDGFDRCASVIIGNISYQYTIILYLLSKVAAVLILKR